MNKLGTATTKPPDVIDTFQASSGHEIMKADSDAAGYRAVERSRGESLHRSKSLSNRPATWQKTFMRWRTRSTRLYDPVY